MTIGEPWLGFELVWLWVMVHGHSSRILSTSADDAVTIEREDAQSITLKSVYFR